MSFSCNSYLNYLVILWCTSSRYFSVVINLISCWHRIYIQSLIKKYVRMKIEIIILSWFGTMFGRHNKIQQLYFFMKMGPLCARGRVTAAFWLVILSSGLPFSSSLSTYIHTHENIGVLLNILCILSISISADDRLLHWVKNRKKSTNF